MFDFYNNYYRDRLSDVLDKYLFMFLFSVGATVIVVMKTITKDPLLAVAIPVSLMILYVLLMRWNEKVRLREDRAADNVYYLGFLYTLVSLSVALYKFGSDVGAGEQIISNFGIALSTTITGLAFRVLLQQMRKDTIELEQEARATLTEAVNSFRHTISNSVSAFETLQIQTNNILTENFKTVIDETIAGLHKSLEEYSTATQTIVSNVDEVLTGFSGSTELMKEATGDLVKEIRNTVSKVKRIKVPEDLIESKIAPVADGMEAAMVKVNSFLEVSNKHHETLANNLGTISDTTMEISNNIEHATNLSEGISKMNEGVNSLVNSMSTLNKSYGVILKQNKQMWDDAKKEMSSRKDVYDENRQNLRDLSSGLSDYNQVMIDEIENLKANSQKFSSALVSVSDTIVSELKDAE